MESEVIPSAVQCSAGGEKIARRAMQGQCAGDQMKQGWVVVRFVMFLAVVARWGKEGGDGPTVQVVLCAQDRPWTLGRALWDFDGPLFRLALWDRLVSLLNKSCLKAVLWHGVLWHGMLWCDVSRCKKKRKKQGALTLEVTHDGDDDEGQS